MNNHSKHCGLLILIMLMFFSTNIFPQSKWSITTSAQMTGGSYIYDEYNNIFLLYGGLRYQTEKFSIYGSIPVVFLNNAAFTQSGMMIIPTGRGEGGNSSNRIEGHHGAGSGFMSLTDMGVGLGDFYLYGSYNLLNEYKHTFALSINPNIKFPTATMGIGTGEFDYGISFNARKSIGTFSILAEAGIIKFGDPAGIDYKDPFTYGIGIGKFISDNGNSILIYYNSYTQVLDGFKPPRQLSLALTIKLAGTSSLSLIGSKGLSNYSPDFSISAGMNFSL